MTFKTTKKIVLMTVKCSLGIYYPTKQSSRTLYRLRTFEFPWPVDSFYQGS